MQTLFCEDFLARIIGSVWIKGGACLSFWQRADTVSQMDRYYFHIRSYFSNFNLMPNNVFLMYSISRKILCVLVF